jgi:glycosyl transferase family 2
MPEPLATILVVPREQFSKTRPSLESILACTKDSVPIVYVDGNSPKHIRRYLETRAAEKRFTLVRRDGYLTSNEARNIGLPYVRTKYVAFVDNDVLASPGWLESLISCAEDTGAWAVGPLYLIGDQHRRLVHTAGADCRIVEQGGRRSLEERHRFVNEPVHEVRHRMRREPIDLAEFHCMLVRMDVFDRLGPLDHELLSFLDHTDFCLAIRNSGGSVYIEPAATVTHLSPPPLAPFDVPYFLLRWSDDWINASCARFSEKHAVCMSDSGFAGHDRYRIGHRRLAIKAFRDGVHRALGWRTLALTDWAFDKFLDGPIGSSYVRRLQRRRDLMRAPA